jgi:phosphate butyryltransferase
MKITDLETLAWVAKENGVQKRAAVVAAHEPHILEAVIRASQEGLIKATLIGDTVAIQDILSDAGENLADYTLVEASDNPDAVVKAIELVRAGSIDFLIKGIIETADLMRGLVNKETGIVKPGAIVSPVALIQSPKYPKIFALSDVGINTFPDQDKKVKILKNAVWLMQRIGVEEPKVALLGAVEKINPKMQDTVDANAIKQLYLNGDLTGCIVEGPISLDLAISKESAAVKKYTSPVAGEADVLIVPDIVSGNLLIKGMGFFGDIQTADVVVGLEVPLVFGSRGGPAEGKFRSIALATLVS